MDTHISNAAATAIAHPSNVPAERVVDFDFFDLAGKAEDVQLAFAILHDGPDIIWTPHHGGHWISTRAEDFYNIQLDDEHFSHSHNTIPKNDRDQHALPLGKDRPEHTFYRRMLNPSFVPAEIRRLQEIARRTAQELIARIAPRGHCEFVGEFAKVLPINVFLGMINVPLEDREYLLPLAEIAVRSSDDNARGRAHSDLSNYISSFVDARTIKPGDDMLSRIIHAEIDGRRMTRDEVLNMAVLVMGGGLDTVASSLGYIAHFLARHPAHLAQLVADPKLYPTACEEFLRRFGLPNTARVVTRDHEYKGLLFKEGDMVQMPRCLINMDDRVVERPHEVDFHRPPASIKHAAFGAGAHICPGALLARREIQVFLEEWLPAIPKFELDPGKPMQMESGHVNGVIELHLKWDPVTLPH